jgi:hypothetical protein
LTGATSSLGYNHATDGSCGLTGLGDTQNGGDPLLGAVADNGGLTPTRLPGPGSPLIDAIDLGGCGDPSPATDQRGIARPQGAGCDIGAVEVEGSVQAPAAEVPALTLSGLLILLIACGAVGLAWARRA